MNYSEIQLHQNIQRGLFEAGYISCTPVQEKVLELLSDSCDLYVQSQTGTGKTAAYLVSIMQMLLEKNESDSQKKSALVLVPTRELAVQVEEEARKIGKYTDLHFASFFGGVGYEKQISALKRGVDIIAGTPGRIIDLLESNQMDLSNVAFLSIDEADRMFDMGFYPDLRKLIRFLPNSENRRTMLFSATLNMNVKNLAYEYTKNPKEITIEAENITVDEIEQELIHISSENKNRLLLGLIQKENPESLIIFCNTKKMCEVLSKRLKINGVQNEFLIGDLPQKRRQRILDDFKSQKIKCLIATDVAARGIDVNDLAMVINYDLPNEAENYVHRIGRTARAGKSGKAYTFCSEQDVYSLMPIERYIEKQIPSRVAIEEDFAEDKSKDSWIRVGDWKNESSEENGRKVKSSRKNRKEKFSKKRENRDNRGNRENRESKEKRAKKNFKARKNQGKATGKNISESPNLSGLSFEERMKFYKEKYGKSVKVSENSADVQQKNPAETEIPSSNDIIAKTEDNNKNQGIVSKIKSLFI